MVKEHLCQRPIEGLFCSPNVQMVGCVLDAPGNPILILCVYRSPSADMTESMFMLQAIERKGRLFDHCIVLGDFNAPTVDWANEVAESDHSFAGCLLETSQELALHQIVRDPTRFREGQSPSTLDLIFCRYENDVSSISVPH